MISIKNCRPPGGQKGVTMNESLKNQGAVPRLAMINDIAGFGRCSTTVSLPVISALGIQVCPIPTSVLSNHLGFSTCYFHDYTPYMREYIQGLCKLGISFQRIYCGFLGSVEQITIVEELLQGPLANRGDCAPVPFLLDPVMGDHGRPYSTITRDHCIHMKKLVKYADIITPNITEACLLTDTPYKEDNWSRQELESICQKLSTGNRFPETWSDAPLLPTGPGKIVITGLHTGIACLNYIWEQGQISTYESPITGASRPGTGDLFASVITGDTMNGISFRDSVKHAADFVALCIRQSEEARTPIQEGVCFERCLPQLFTSIVKTH